MSDLCAMMFTSAQPKGFQMSNFDTSAPIAFKTSSPDWIFDGVCECLLTWCPTCDPDSFHDQMRDDFSDWDSFEEVETPF
jgi:hypothetical protein